MKNRILSCLMALVFIVVLAVNASATTEMPNLEEKGSLTLTMHYDGQPLETGNVNILALGEVAEISENVYDFKLFASLGKTTLTQKELYSAEVAESLLTNAKKVYAGNIISAPISDGKAVFNELNTGLYVVWQEEIDACDGMSAFQPFLISVPRWQADAYVMDVVAAPKVPLLPEPTEPPGPPPPPPPPELPYTGQLNWPIPVMAVSGAMLMIIGLILCVSRKRSNYEK